MNNLPCIAGTTFRYTPQICFMSDLLGFLKVPYKQKVPVSNPVGRNQNLFLTVSPFRL